MTRKIVARIHRAVMVLLPLAGLVVTGSGCVGYDIEDLRTEGVQQYQQKRYIDSMGTLRYALELKPTDAVSNYYMGLNYRALADKKFEEENYSAAYRDLDTAIRYFDEVIKSWPNHIQAVAAKNEALESRGKFEQALLVAKDSADLNRGRSAKHFIYLGNEYRERGDYDNALRVYQIALRQSPNSATVHAEMGKLYERIGSFDTAREMYRKAYRLNPAEPGVAEALERLSY